MTQKLEALHLEALCEEVRREGGREEERDGVRKRVQLFWLTLSKLCANLPK